MSFNDYWIPVIRASLELTRNHSERAIELLQRSAPYEMASPVTWSELGGPYYPAYLRGATDFALHRGTEAAAEYQKILDHPGFMRVYSELRRVWDSHGLTWWPAIPTKP